MENLKFYEVKAQYVDYMSRFAPHLFNSKKAGDKFERKYIGVVFRLNDYEYFAPLSSFKAKHQAMKEGLDFIKIKDYAVVNLNNMFPVPESERVYVDIKNQTDPHYRALLLSEYRYIKSIQDKIRRNAKNLYKLKLKDGDSSALARRCNDFALLEKKCSEYLG